MRRAVPLFALLLVALVTVAAEPSPAPSSATVPVTARIAGADRFATAVAISQVSFPSGADAAVVATGRGFADALAGGAAAVLLGAPVLLVETDHVPAVVAAELTRLDPERVVLLGGEVALTAAVADQVQQASGVPVERIAGPTRFDTAAAVAGLFPAGPPVAYVATGTNFPDALAGSAAAGVRGAPMLLVEPDEVPATVGLQLTRLDPGAIVVLGGSGVVSDGVATALGQYAPVERVAGADRYATAALIATSVFPDAVGATLATGVGFADALAAAPAAARAATPVLLTPPSCAAQPVIDYLRVRGWPGVVVVGGEAAVSDRAFELWPCTPVPDGVVAPGVEFSRRFLAGPNVAHLLVVDRRVGVTVESTLATETLRGRETTSSLARREGAVAAINGDFFTADGRPVHAFAAEGRLLLAPGLLENQYALDSTRNDNWYLGIPEFDQRLVLDDDSSVPIARANDGQPTGDEVGLFTSEAEGDPAPPSEACTARLRPTAPPAVDAAGAAAQPHEVISSSCSASPATVPEGDVVLATPSTSIHADNLDDLVAGDEVTLTWQLHPTWTGVTDSTGGNPLLVVGGVVTDELLTSTGGPYSLRAPRTGVGFLPDGRMLLLAVDGRQPGYSIGMTLREFAELFLSVGAVGALNLDGGGSTAMVLQGVLANQPSDAAGERPVGTALLFYSGPQQPLASTFAPTLVEPADAALPMELDSASLGGYASERRARGEPLTPELRDAADRYDASVKIGP